MKPRTIRYYIREAVRSLIVNRLMSIASIFTVASCIFIVSMFFILGSHVSFFVQQLGDSLGLVVFIEEGTTDVETARLERHILDIQHVASVRYVSSHNALIDLRERMDHPPFLQGLENNNPLRASFEIELTDIAYQDQVENALENLRSYGVGGILRDAELGRILMTLSDVVNIISVILILILGIVAIVIITNTINITVNARRTEINIMKYVGATDWFIRWPFIIEGVLIGLIGGAIPAFITWFGHDRVINSLGGIQELAFIQFVPRGIIFAQLLPFALLLGTAIGLIGSGLSLRKHLKV
ncbi:MAG: permease-like cell division protein FtsX [Defluviitaleaceae bacterium]|nr:permease-like cell division protein FtsX [Defluviitaleaceae bacterium]